MARYLQNPVLLPKDGVFISALGRASVSDRHARFSDAGMTRWIHGLWRPASEKRQGTKSREVGGGGAADAMGIWPRDKA